MGSYFPSLSNQDLMLIGVSTRDTKLLYFESLMYLVRSPEVALLCVGLFVCLRDGTCTPKKREFSLFLRYVSFSYAGERLMSPIPFDQNIGFVVFASDGVVLLMNSLLRFFGEPIS